MATFEVQFVKSLVKLACKMRSLHILKRIYFMTKELRDSAPLCLMHASSVYFNLYFAISQFYTLGLRHSGTPRLHTPHSATPRFPPNHSGGHCGATYLRLQITLMPARWFKTLTRDCILSNAFITFYICHYIHSSRLLSMFTAWIYMVEHGKTFSIIDIFPEIIRLLFYLVI